MPGPRRSFLLPDATIEELDAIAAALPRDAGEMPATRTDALILAVNQLASGDMPICYVCGEPVKVAAGTLYLNHRANCRGVEEFPNAMPKVWHYILPPDPPDQPRETKP